ncbi:hypothetical protein BC829DRAFT_80865 [Chytridium lagenaria]|nr:hypothetical protein BC829DRAFT_80865 [Chytridium lagenaria]
MTTTPLMWVGRLLHTLGLILLVHAGYSAVEHLGYLKLVGRTEKSLPVEMIVECFGQRTSFHCRCCFAVREDEGNWNGG